MRSISSVGVMASRETSDDRRKAAVSPACASEKSVSSSS
jgi:hypothetical protein